MPPVKRRLFNLAAAVSLVLCVAGGGLWMRSYLSQTKATVKFGGASGEVFQAIPLFAKPDRAAFVGSVPGRVLFIHQWVSAPGPLAGDASNCGVFGEPSSVVVFPSVVVYSPPALFRDTTFLGFGQVSETFPSASGTTFRCSALSVPFWVLFLATTGLPSWWLHRRLMVRRRSRAGLCPACGYDLRATPDRCPECGTEAAARSAEGIAA